MVLYRMYSTIRFNRPITKNDFISPGGYEFKMNGRTVSFDFLDYTGTIQDDDKTIIHCEQKNLDIDSFEDIKSITLDDLLRIEDIIDFYIYFGDDSLVPEVLNIEFEALVNEGKSNEDIMKISVPSTLISKYNKKLLYSDNLIRNENIILDPIFK